MFSKINHTQGVLDKKGKNTKHEGEKEFTLVERIIIM